MLQKLFDQSYITLIFHLLEYLIIAGILFVIFYIGFRKTFKRNKIQNRKQKKNDFLREIKYSLVTILMLSFMWVMVVATPLRNYTLLYNEITLLSGLWILPSIIIALFIHDTYFYWMHRLLHQPSLFSRFHLIHHRSSNPSPWASYSFHIGEAFTESLIIPILAFILPMHEISLLLFSMSAFTINAYGHLGYEIAPKWFRKSFLFNYINSSVHHNMHHRYSNVNYGLYFRFWDKIMGTESPHYVKKYDKIQEKRF